MSDDEDAGYNFNGYDGEEYLGDEPFGVEIYGEDQFVEDLGDGRRIIGFNIPAH